MQAQRARRLAAFAVMLLLAGCAGRPEIRLEPPPDRAFRPDEVFDGRFTGRGAFQSTGGGVRHRFVVTGQGRWDGTHLRLVEDYTFDTGRTHRRDWTLHRDATGGWVGTEPGAAGPAIGRQTGPSFAFAYTYDMRFLRGRPFRLRFDDRFWRLSEDRALAVGLVSFLGVRVGHVTVLMALE